MVAPKNIAWLAWSKETFEKAKQENKPILLSISAVWCHWCHIMDETTFSTPEVSQLINQNFIPIRVDTDERPEINERYNMGGWPTVVLLTSQGAPIQGTTYLPKDSFISFLQESLAIYGSQKEILNKNYSENLQERIQTKSVFVLPSLDVLQSIQLFSSNVRNSFDLENFGFGSAPKFPHTPLLKFLYFNQLHSKNPEYLKFFIQTLQKMAQSELFDKEAGGFFRYSMQADWAQPHFEKMSEDHAELLDLYCFAFLETNQTFFKQIIEKTVNFILTEWQDSKTKAFSASTDADEHYYSLSLSERKKHPHPFIDQRHFTDWNSLLVSSLLLASEILEKPELKENALQTLDYLLFHHFQNNQVFHFNSPQAPVHLLSDYAFLLKACLDAYSFSFNSKYLDQAKALLDLIVEKFYSDSEKAFLDISKNFQDFGELNHKTVSFKENAVLITCLNKLAFLLQKSEYETKAVDLSKRFLSQSLSENLMAASLFSALYIIKNGLTEVKLVGSFKDPETQKMLSILRKHSNNSLVFEFIENSDKSKLALFSLPETLTQTQAIVCKKKVCLTPVKIAVELEKILKE
ncbi:MAG: DUF255 domain-containing protein [Candidatus Diapherotrites archaeon]|nr:DUF255 domain-containing protein [Candidatus Diapherotrites archaeon]